MTSFLAFAPSNQTAKTSKIPACTIEGRIISSFLVGSVISIIIVLAISYVVGMTCFF